MFSLICTRLNGWVNNGEAGDLRRHRSHYDVTVMYILFYCFDVPPRSLCHSQCMCRKRATSQYKREHCRLVVVIFIPFFWTILTTSAEDLTPWSCDTLRWRHNEHDSVSNHQPHDCLRKLYSGADHRKHKSSESLVFVRGIQDLTPWSCETLRWRHNEHDSVSNHQPHDCLRKLYSGADHRKHKSSESLVFVRGIHRGPVNSPHKRPVTRKMFPFDDVIMMRL